ncbi:MAG: hypothetical protein KME15_21135 [Drouetiella hepatica Uher 2000/2452]|jgi:hypothetical protein|uniref:Uncharacterized protein n=1 Tax=Drouetiella hepatica Uher 2000/2452 TaxID=904376 RepID=A0A951UPU4_9CYAN|nr:hypothetical protein [Drouetiella hepatica Uher 2000/2452]
MKPAISWLEYQQLELILPAKPVKVSWCDRLLHLWREWMCHLTQPTDIQISSVCDASGKVWWSGYDPQTQRSLHQVSENEIRVWIERRYLS